MTADQLDVAAETAAGEHAPVDRPARSGQSDRAGVAVFAVGLVGIIVDALMQGRGLWF